MGKIAEMTKWQCDICDTIVENDRFAEPPGWGQVTLFYGYGYEGTKEKTYTTCDACKGRSGWDIKPRDHFYAALKKTLKTVFWKSAAQQVDVNGD